MKKLFLIVLTVVALSLCMLPAIGVNAESNQMEISGAYTPDFNFGDVEILKSTGNGTFWLIDPYGTEWEGGIVATDTDSVFYGQRHYGGDRMSWTSDDVVIVTTSIFLESCIIAGEDCVNVTICLHGIDMNGSVAGTGTISGETEDGGQVYGTFKWGAVSGPFNPKSYEGEVHFTP